MLDSRGEVLRFAPTRGEHRRQTPPGRERAWLSRLPSPVTVCCAEPSGTKASWAARVCDVPRDCSRGRKDCRFAQPFCAFMDSCSRRGCGRSAKGPAGSAGLLDCRDPEHEPTTRWAGGRRGHDVAPRLERRRCRRVRSRPATRVRGTASRGGPLSGRRAIEHQPSSDGAGQRVVPAPARLAIGPLAEPRALFRSLGPDDAACARGHRAATTR